MCPLLSHKALAQKPIKKMAPLAPMRYVLLAAVLRLDISKHPSRVGP
jgi:hypothetical protein